MSNFYNKHKVEGAVNTQVTDDNDLKRQDEKFIRQLKKWTSFYRENMHRFVQHYLGIELFFYQMIVIYLMNLHTIFMWVASRGTSKSFIIAIFSCARCILYPYTKIVIASGTKGQSKLIISEKIEKELMKYPNLAREIKQIKTSSNEAKVVFHNGSTIVAVTSSENSRGYRANILILEEFRLIKKTILESVLKPFLNVYRQPPFLKKAEYAHLAEENIEIYISSAFYCYHWMWDAMQSTRDMMMEGKDSIFLAMDYLLTIHHGLLSKKRVLRDKQKADFDPINFHMEYENKMYGQNGDALFQLPDIQKNKTLKKAFYPIKNINYAEQKSKRKEKLKAGEIRIIGIDLSVMGGDKNDATVFTCMRLLPHGDHYEMKVPYIESMEGGHSEDQAIRIKQLFEDFQASYISMDCNGVGIGIYDSLVKLLYDEERDVEYEPWCAFNDEKMRARAKGQNPLPVVYSIKADAKGNHEMITKLRLALQNSKIELLQSVLEIEDFLNKNKDYKKASLYEKDNFFKLPYKNTTILLNELVNVNHEIIGGHIKLKEKSSKRKDYICSIMYAVYYAFILGEQNLYVDYDENENETLVFY